MISRKLFFVFILFAIFSKTGRSQNSGQGYLRLKVRGGAPLCRIDSSTFRSSDTLLMLASGTHRLKIGMPITELIDTTITIIANDTLKYNAVLILSPKYIQYKKDYAAYLQKRNRRGFVSPIWIGLTIGTGIFINQQFAKKQFNQALDAKEAYSSTSNQVQMDLAENDFEKHKKKYYDIKKIEYGIYGVSVVLFVNYIRILIKQKNTPAPLFNNDNFLSRVEMNLYPDTQNKNVYCSFKLKF